MPPEVDVLPQRDGSSRPGLLPSPISSTRQMRPSVSIVEVASSISQRTTGKQADLSTSWFGKCYGFICLQIRKYLRGTHAAVSLLTDKWTRCRVGVLHLGTNQTLRMVWGEEVSVLLRSVGLSEL